MVCITNGRHPSLPQSVREYETGSLKEDHHEQWYNLHLWGPIVDQCFADVTDMEAVRLVLKNVFFLSLRNHLTFGTFAKRSIRGESSSVASGLRENANR